MRLLLFALSDQLEEDLAFVDFSLPVLIKLLDYGPDHKTRGHAEQILESIGAPATRALAQDPPRQYEDLYLAKIWNLQYVPTHPEAVPEHVSLLLDGDYRVRVFAARVLSRLGEDGLSALSAMLDSQDQLARLRGLRASRSFSWAQRDLVPRLSPFLNAESGSERRAASYALGGMVPESLPTLLDALESPDVDVRRLSAEAIQTWIPTDLSSNRTEEQRVIETRSGEPDGQAAADSAEDLFWELGHEALARSLEDPDEFVRVQAAFAFFKLGKRARRFERQIRAACDNHSTAVSYWARQATRSIESGPWDDLLALMENLDPESNPRELNDPRLQTLLHEVRDGELWSIRSADGWEWVFPDEPDPRWSAAEEILRGWMPSLLAAASRTDARAEYARSILHELEDAYWLHVSALLYILEDEWGPGPAGDALTELGPAALPALAVDYLRCRFPVGPGCYDELIAVLETHEVRALPALTLGLQHWRHCGRVMAPPRIASLGEIGLPAAPLIISAWRNDVSLGDPGGDRFWDFGRCSVALSALGNDVIPLLREALRDDLPFVRARACKNLGVMGQAARVALPELLPLLEDELEVREAAARAIIQLASDGSDEARAARQVLEQ